MSNKISTSYAICLKLSQMLAYILILASTKFHELSFTITKKLTIYVYMYFD